MKIVIVQGIGQAGKVVAYWDGVKDLFSGKTIVNVMTLFGKLIFYMYHCFEFYPLHVSIFNP
ncbi:MAG: hypothetical protein D6714_06350, partial [Bacteroidetes bacterium]